MHTYICFLGRQGALSMQELEAVCRAQNLPKPTSFGTYALLDTPDALPDNFIDQIGGIDRVAEKITEFPSFPTAGQVLAALSPLPGKWVVGLSVWNTPITSSIKKFAIDIKKEAKTLGSKVKFVTSAGKHPQLNAAQVAFNKLDQHPNAELTIMGHEHAVLLLRTVQIQDIIAYEKRDTARPARDAKSGMLPPKLAQMMLNIAVGHLPDGLRQAPIRILDPFCGSGTVLQEGWLADHAMFGSDASLEAIEASKKNLAYLAREFKLDASIAPEIIARNVASTFPSAWRNSFSAVVTEPFLGPPVKTPLPPSLAEARVRELAAIYRPAFKNFHSLLKTGGVAVFLFPVFFTQNGWLGFPNNIIDGISQIGYRLVQLSAQERGLVYKRPDALVARELILWIKL